MTPDHAELSLQAHMSQNSLPYDGPINFEGRCIRFKDPDKYTGNADAWLYAYEIKPGMYTAVYYSWRRGNDKHIWKSYAPGEIPADEEIDLLQKHREKEAKERYNYQLNRKKIFEEFWSHLKPCESHSYLERKQVRVDRDFRTSFDGRDTRLMVPLYNAAGELKSCQAIWEDGTKRFFSGLPVAGLFFPTNDFKDADTLYLCEGIATALSLEKVLKTPVISCNSVNNILVVGKILKESYPSKNLILCRDNGIAGEKLGVDWEILIGKEIYNPTPDYSDFNDMQVAEGNEPIEKMLMKRGRGLSLKDLLELQAVPTSKITDIIFESKIHILYSDAGIGKSRFAMELSWCIAGGVDFLGWKTHEKKKVLYIEGEMTNSEMQARTVGLIPRYQDLTDVTITTFTREQMVKDLDREIDLFQEKDREYLEHEIDQHDFIVLDNYNCLTFPSDSESWKPDAVNWKKFCRWMRDWKAKGKTFLVIMHCVKDGRLEGARQIRAEVDSIYKLQKFDVGSTRDNLLCGFDFSFEKSRDVPVMDQLTKRCKLYTKITENNCRSRGWYVGTAEI